MRNLWVISRLTMADMLHRKVLYALAALIVLNGILLLVGFLVGTYYFADSDAISQMGAPLLGMYSTVLSTLGRVSFLILAFVAFWSEFSRGTVVMLLSKSATRLEFFLGKFLGLAILAAGYALLTGAFTTLLSLVLQSSVPTTLLYHQLETFVLMAITIASVFLFLSYFNIAAAVTGWVLLYVGSSVLWIFLQIELPFLTPLARATRYLFPATYAFDSSQQMVLQVAPATSFWESYLPIIHGLDYAALLLLAGLFLFYRRDLLVR